MANVTKEQLRRQRTREYESALEGAASPVGVMVLFAKGREARAGDQSLEEAFAAAPVPGGEEAPRLPAAVWVALRQGDVDATIDALLHTSPEQFVIGSHEQLDETYRLTTVEERRALPDIELLEAQVASFLQLPRDVVAITASWGPDDPRTEAEIEKLLDQRFGPVTSPADSPHPAVGQRRRGQLSMSSAEFTALLSLTPEQAGVLRTLVRQTDVVISGD